MEVLKNLRDFLKNVTMFGFRITTILRFIHFLCDLVILGQLKNPYESLYSLDFTP